MAAGRAQANGIELEYETFGNDSDPALLLVMGLGMQLIHWQVDFCEQLVERGFHVIRFDNRDAGLSSSIDAPVPSMLRMMTGVGVDAPYLLDDMASDAFGLLDWLQIDAAHVVGASMGGMIAQTMAMRRPQRVLSLTSIMSNTGERRTSRPKLRVMGPLVRRAPHDRQGFIDHMVKVFTAIGSAGLERDQDELRAMVTATYDRGYNTAGTGRQLAAIVASGDRTEELRQVRVPTAIVHGLDDPLVPYRGGRATAHAIEGARLVSIPGMGHDLPRQVWPQVIEAIVSVAGSGGRWSGASERASASVAASSSPSTSS